MSVSRRVIPSFELAPRGPEGSFDQVADALARYEGGSRYDIINGVLGLQKDGSDPLTKWTATEITELLRVTLGPAEEWAEIVLDMGEKEMITRFPSESVREVVFSYALYGRFPEQEE
jgi:hypothetical protein